MGIDAEGVLLEESENGWKICSWAMDLPRTTLGPKYSLLSHLTLGCASKKAEQVEVQKKGGWFQMSPPLQNHWPDRNDLFLYTSASVYHISFEALDCGTWLNMIASISYFFLAPRPREKWADFNHPKPAVFSSSWILRTEDDPHLPLLCLSSQSFKSNASRCDALSPSYQKLKILPGDVADVISDQYDWSTAEAHEVLKIFGTGFLSSPCIGNPYPCKILYNLTPKTDEPDLWDILYPGY